MEWLLLLSFMPTAYDAVQHGFPSECGNEGASDVISILQGESWDFCAAVGAVSMLQASTQNKWCGENFSWVGILSSRQVEENYKLGDPQLGVRLKILGKILRQSQTSIHYSSKWKLHSFSSAPSGPGLMSTIIQVAQVSYNNTTPTFIY